MVKQDFLQEIQISILICLIEFNAQKSGILKKAEFLFGFWTFNFKSTMLNHSIANCPIFRHMMYLA